MIWSNSEELQILTFCWLQFLCFDLFLARFWFGLLTFIKFSIYTRLLYFNPGWNIFNPGWNFSSNCIFFQVGIPSWNFSLAWKFPYNHPFTDEEAISLAQCAFKSLRFACFNSNVTRSFVMRLGPKMLPSVGFEPGTF